MRWRHLLWVGVLLWAPEAMAAAESAYDLCAPCNSAVQCSANYCAIEANQTVGICTQACQTDADCPTAFECSSSVCVPSTDTTCPDPYPSAINTVCQFPPDVGSTNTVLNRDCAANLYCYVFPADSSGYGTGVCVQACSSLSPNIVCPFGDTCCYGTNSDGSCTSTVSSSIASGGCFDVRDVGELCAAGNQSYCLSGATCMYPQTPSAAKCYDTCDNGLCNEGGTCQVVQNMNVCCNASTFVTGDATSCDPAPGYCRRPAGVQCTEDAQCRQGLCYKVNQEAACTVPCSTTSDCTAANGNVAMSCQDFSGTGYCWPVGSPADPPACASIAIDTSALTKGSGCNCQSGATAWGVWPLGLAFALRRRRRRRP